MFPGQQDAATATCYLKSLLAFFQKDCLPRVGPLDPDRVNFTFQANLDVFDLKQSS